MISTSKLKEVLLANNGLLACIGGALIVTLVTGFVYGRLTQRWGPATDLVAKGRHLESFPKEIGDWLLSKDDTLSKAVQETLECTGFVNRQYVNRKTGDKVDIAVYVGPAGPISVHTPEICYSSQAYAIETPRQMTTLPGPNDRTNTFWQLTFRTLNTSSDVLRVYYSWSTGSNWIAANSSRFEFGGLPSLYKLQIASPIPNSEANNSQDPCRSFLAELLRCGWALE